MCASFIALYRGPSIGEARLIATSADPALVAEITARLLGQRDDGAGRADPVLVALDEGRNRALRLVQREASDRA